MECRYMNQRILAGCFSLFVVLSPVRGQDGSVTPPIENLFKLNPSSVRTSIVADIKDMLNRLALTSDNAFFQNHCLSIISVLDAVPKLTSNDSLLLEGLYTAFSDTTIPYIASRSSSYLARKRPFILSWTSPTDGAISLAWLIPPENWNPEQAYPLYVRLHGLSDIYGNRIQYLTRYLGPQLVFEGTFEDGYTLLPWGRGNLWYQGIADTDVWESIQAAESYVRVNPARKYLVGHSMGGYGAWALGQRFPETWAAVGVFAGALWYNGGSMLTEAVARRLKDVPVYIVCGLNDGLLNYNETAFQLLKEAGNPDIAFVTFPGGHEAPLANWQDMYAWIRDFTNDNPVEVDHPVQPWPSHVGLIGNYPNPFNSETLFRYEIRIQSDVELTIYDPAGRKIRKIFMLSEKPGEHEIRWDGRDDSGMPGPSGMYVCRMLTKDSNTSLKILMLK
jgi:pimeloyl-ACP methyl ester carboxylesterase